MLAVGWKSSGLVAVIKTLQYEPGLRALKNTAPSPSSLVNPEKVYLGTNF